MYQFFQMKHTNVFTTAALLFLSSCTSEFRIIEADVPPLVLTAFQAKYPVAKDVEWEAEKTEGRLAFEAEFKIDGKRKEAYFSPDGRFLKEE
jgi:hypothetical protein